jgi:hypothetical protein
MTITYGLADYDRFTGTVDWNINLPMEGVQCGTMYEFCRARASKAGSFVVRSPPLRKARSEHFLAQPSCGRRRMLRKWWP